MTRFFCATLVFVAIFISGACSSATEEKPSAHSNTTAVNANTNVAAVQSNSDVANPPAADPNAQNSASAGPFEGPGANRMQSKLKALREGGGEPIDNAQVEAAALKNARPAPDNSTYVSYLTDVGYEVRIFKNHPQLLRVEKRIAPEGETIKVSFRDGRVVQLPAKSISVIATATANAILAAAGVQPAEVPQKSAASDSKKQGK